MTIQMQHLTIEADDAAWIAGTEGVNVTEDARYRVDLLSVVRHIMRERSDCTMIPVVHSAIVHPTNQWGHNMTVEVTYARRGYRAVYGVTMGERVTEVSCYMD